MKKYIGIACIVLGIIVGNSHIYAANHTFSSPAEVTKFCSQGYARIVTQYQQKIDATIGTERTTYASSYATFLDTWNTYCAKKPSVTISSPSATGSTISTKPLTAIDESYFTEIDSDIIKTFSKEVQDEVATLTLHYKKIFLEIIQGFKKDGLLTDKELFQMKRKVYLYYIPDCSSIKGKTSVTQYFDSQGALTRSYINALLLRVNVCDKTEIYPAIIQHAPELITHELGHVYNFTRDTPSNEFRNICWDGETLKDICRYGGFFSAYARTNPDEDYAETFASRRMKHFPNTIDEILKKKYEYFANRLGK